MMLRKIAEKSIEREKGRERGRKKGSGKEIQGLASKLLR